MSWHRTGLLLDQFIRLLLSSGAFHIVMWTWHSNPSLCFSKFQQHWLSVTPNVFLFIWQHLLWLYRTLSKLRKWFLRQMLQGSSMGTSSRQTIVKKASKCLIKVQGTNTPTIILQSWPVWSVFPKPHWKRQRRFYYLSNSGCSECCWKTFENIVSFTFTGIPYLPCVSVCVWLCLFECVIECYQKNIVEIRSELFARINFYSFTCCV